MNTIKCHKCGTGIEIDKAIEGQIESRLLTELNERHQKEILEIKNKALLSANEKMKAELEIKFKEYRENENMELEKVKARLKHESEQSSLKRELLIERLSIETESAKKINEELREELKKVTSSLLEAQKAREETELKTSRKIIEEAGKIREEAKKEADELHRLKELELQKQLNDTKKALDEAQRKAEQGSQQNQGEVLELELEALLKNEFPADEITEYKKGQRGADIRHLVKNKFLEDCGIMVWELKNAKEWKKDWVLKIKDNIREAKASVGIIVSCELPERYGDAHNIELNVWAVKPKFSLALAAALRSTLIQVYSAVRSSENKDEKTARMYEYLTGVEFGNRIRAIIDNYNILQEEIEKERRAANLRWGKQEKAIRSVIDNTYGFYGDIQGLTGNVLKDSLLIGTSGGQIIADENNELEKLEDTE